jgi:hypothetical protein
MLAIRAKPTYTKAYRESMIILPACSIAADRKKGALNETFKDPSNGTLHWLQFLFPGLRPFGAQALVLVGCRHPNYVHRRYVHRI